jgi:hypothetical protein
LAAATVEAVEVASPTKSKTSARWL